jgi:hypothetical protein
MKGKSTFVTIPLSLWESKISFPRRMVKTRRRPPEIMKKTRMARNKLKMRGSEG